MKRLFLPSACLASLLPVLPVHAEVIDSTVITDFVDQTPGFNVTRPLGVTISGDEAVYLVGTMNFDPMELGSSFVEANMGDTNTDRVYVAGFGNGFGGNTIVIAEDGTEATAPQTFDEGVPTLLVVKFDQTTGDATLWVDPDLSETEDLNPADATATVGLVNGSSFDSVVFRAGDFDAEKSVVDFTDFAVYYNGDTPFGSLPEFTPKLVNFTYDGLNGDSEVSIEGEASTAYVLVEADDLDFGNPDQNPVPLTGATVGTLSGDQITTDGDGNATIQFNLGTARPATFIRAEAAPPPPPLLSEDFEAGDGGFTMIDHSGGAGSVWQWGAPNSDGNVGGGAVTGGAGDPPSANCWGTDISNPGTYLAGTDTSLISPIIDMTDVAAATLSFAQAIDIFSPDALVVNLIEADISGGINTIGDPLHSADDDGTINEADWKTISGLDLSAGSGQQVRIEWRFAGNQTDGTYIGAYIDDVLIERAAP